MKAITAVEHFIPTAVWHMLANGESYDDPGVDHFTRADLTRAWNNAVKKLNSLGFSVILAPATAA